MKFIIENSIFFLEAPKIERFSEAKGPIAKGALRHVSGDAQGSEQFVLPCEHGAALGGGIVVEAKQMKRAVNG